MSQPHEDRVIAERNELLERYEKLCAFIQTNPVYHSLESAERERLCRQLVHMGGYLDVLEQRIAAFTR